MSGARAWALSLALHVILLAAVLGITRLVTDKPEVLRWQVSLVDMPAPEPPVAAPTSATAPSIAKPVRPSKPLTRPMPMAAAGQPAELSPSPPPTSTESEAPTSSSGTQAKSGDDVPSTASVSPSAARLPAPSPTGEPAATLAGSPVRHPSPATHDQPAVASERLWYAALVERLRDQRRYPAQARRRGQEGVVALEVLVEADGSLRELSVRRGSGYPLLDRAAEELVRRAMDDVRDRLRPERITRLEIPIAYQLNSD